MIKFAHRPMEEAAVGRVAVGLGADLQIVAAPHHVGVKEIGIAAEVIDVHVLRLAVDV